MEYSAALPGVLSGCWSLLIGRGQGRRSFIIAAGLDVSQGIPCLVADFSGPGVISSLSKAVSMVNKSEALSLRLFDVGQNLLVLRA